MNYDWQNGLPPESLGATVTPLTLESFADKMAYARKTKGYDAAGALCFYHHAYSMPNERFDEDGIFQESEAHYQEVTAWRLYTGDWLVRRYEAGEQGVCGSRLVPPSYAVMSSLPAL
jgi:hypothetical protein